VSGSDLAIRAFAILTGSVLVMLMIADVFQSVVLPRAANFRFRVSSRLSRWGWPVVRDYALRRIPHEEKREDFLASYAPFALVAFIVLWIGGLIVGFGAILYGLRGMVHGIVGYDDSLYFAGASLLTIGYGDLYPVGGPARLVAILAGAFGLGVFAITTAFLFAVFGSFQNREVFVVSFGARAGSPPSGVTLLETYAELGIPGELGAIFERGVSWSATVLESHLAYPILGYFRSSHDRESWIATLGALLDAAALASTVVADRPLRAHATFFLDMGGHVVHDLAKAYHLEAPGAAGIERAEFDIARDRLRAAGLTVLEGDEIWTDFCLIRSKYVESLQAMAHFWAIPPAMWIGDRGNVPHGPSAGGLDSNGVAASAA
jgi:hypothetical protein